MLWIQSDTGLADHPKTRRLAVMLGAKIPLVMGYLHCLWHWTMEYAPTGDLSKYSAEEISGFARCDKEDCEPERFLQALITCEWIDKDTMEIHDWHDTAGKLLEKREKNAERQRQARDKRVTSALRARDKRVTCALRARDKRVTSHATVQYSTVPYSTNTSPENLQEEIQPKEKQPLESIGQAEADNYAPTPIQTQQRAEERETRPRQTTSDDGDNFATGTERFEASFSPKYAEVEKALKSVRAENKKTAKTNTLAPAWREGITSLVRLLENEPLWTVDDIKTRYRAFLQAQAQAQRTGKDDWVKVAGLAAFANNIDKFQPVDGGQKDEPPVPIPKSNKLTSEEMKARESGIEAVKKALGMKG